MFPPSEIGRDLKQLEADLRQLEAEYNMYFAGRMPRPPVESRGRVLALVKRLDRTHISNYAERFRFSTLQGRFHALVDLWDRGLRAREEGRRGPFVPQRPTTIQRPDTPTPTERVLHVTSFQDPVRELDKLQELHQRLSDARREIGEDVVPFHKFADLVKDQVQRLRQEGSPEVAFRIVMKDGKVNFTAKGLRGAAVPDDESS